MGKMGMSIPRRGARWESRWAFLRAGRRGVGGVRRVWGVGWERKEGERRALGG